MLLLEEIPVYCMIVTKEALSYSPLDIMQHNRRERECQNGEYEVYQGSLHSVVKHRQ